MTTSSIKSIDLEIFGATDVTRWCLLVLRSQDGHIGVGEATLQKYETEVLAAADRILPGLVGQSATPSLVGAHHLPSLVDAAVYSAVSQACWDIDARASGRSVAAHLGGPADGGVSVYANINRGTTDRSTTGFASRAQKALDAGHRAIKIAPFDEVAPGRAGQPASLLDPGLARIQAVRDTVGPGVRLMVDCHWRLNPPLARALIEGVRDMGLYWLECPLPENDEMLAEIRHLRHLANGSGMRLAGVERGFGVASFEPFIAEGVYDVLMPDIKYIGSIDEMMRLADRVKGTDVELSLHNPSGPVSHAASLHVSSCIGADERLEMQFDETPLFRELCPSVPKPFDGVSPLPHGPGLGAMMTEAVLAGHRKLARRYE